MLLHPLPLLKMQLAYYSTATSLSFPLACDYPIPHAWLSWLGLWRQIGRCKINWKGHRCRYPRTNSALQAGRLMPHDN